MTHVAVSVRCITSVRRLGSSVTRRRVMCRCVCQVYYKRKKARQQCDKASSDVSLCMSGVLQA